MDSCSLIIFSNGLTISFCYFSSLEKASWYYFLFFSNNASNFLILRDVCFSSYLYLFLSSEYSCRISRLSIPSSTASLYQFTISSSASNCFTWAFNLPFSSISLGMRYCSSSLCSWRVLSCDLKSWIVMWVSGMILNLRCSFNRGTRQSKKLRGVRSSRAYSASMVGDFWARAISQKIQCFSIFSLSSSMS